MHKQQSAAPENTFYTFTRAKNTYEENGTLYITLFCRLAIETASGSQSIWAELDEIKWEQAPLKLRKQPDMVHAYSVSEELFQELKRLSGSCHEKLYELTPLYKTKRVTPLN